MCFRVIACVAVLAAVGLAAIPVARYGPNDLRYPDYIVFPKLNCNKEGYFPHPRNCSWFYRCNDRIGRGFFWNTIYECEPGTVFSDDLDQCIFPHDPKYPCKPTNGTVCETVKSSCKNYDTCSYDGSTVQSSWLCQSQQCTINGVSQPVSDICQNGKLFSNSLNRCVQKPQSGNPCPPTCDILDDSCKNYDVCKPLRRNVRLCSLELCHQGAESSNKTLCKDQQLYDLKSRTCVNEPADSDLCENQEDCNIDKSSYKKFNLCDPVERNVTLYKSKRCTIGGMNQNVTVTDKCSKKSQLYDNQNKACVDIPSDSDLCKNKPDCNIDKSSCENLCEPAPGKRNVTLCKSEICTIGGVDPQKTDKCPEPLFYDIQNKACVAKPSDYKLCNIVQKDKSYNYNCSSIGEYYTISSQCEKFTMCNRTSNNPSVEIFVESMKLCCAYYECYQTESGWDSEEKFCNTDYIFSDKDKACIPKPNNAELCTEEGNTIPTCKRNEKSEYRFERLNLSNNYVLN